jgi:hypothetical protein
MGDENAQEKTLCKAVWYWARQTEDKVTLYVVCVHPTEGYEVSLEESPIAIYPPEYILWHTAPTGPVPDVVTVELVSASFPASDPIDAVILHDADGEHTVPVEDVPEYACEAWSA